MKCKRHIGLNAIILITKKVIFNAKTNMPTPSFECVRRNVKLLFNYERLKFRIKGREDKFEKISGLMIDYFDE